MAISTLVAEFGKKDIILKQILNIYYLFYFLKNAADVKALINLSSKINTLILAYIANLSLKVQSTNIGAQKIDDFIIKMFEIVPASF